MAAVSKVLVVGGGIAGMACAIALHEQGIGVEIAEVSAEWKVYHVGIVVQENFIRALDAIGLAEAAVAVGFPYNGSRFCDAAGNLVDEIPGIVENANGHCPYLGITRPALHEVLTTRVKELGIPVRLGVTFNLLREDADGMAVDFTDGTSGRYDLVVGADGNYSKVRGAIFPEAPAPQFTGQGVWRYNIPRPKSVDWSYVFMGGDHGKAGIIPLSEETMYVWLTTTEPGNPRKAQATLADEMREKMASFGGMIAQVREQITDPELVVYRPLEAIIMPNPWHRGRAILIGDAAHSATPHQGQGAAMAIEDAVVLVQELCATDELGVAFDRFMARRFERAKFVGLASIEIGSIEQNNHAGGDVVELTAAVRRRLAEPI